MFKLILAPGGRDRDAADLQRALPGDLQHVCWTKGSIAAFLIEDTFLLPPSSGGDAIQSWLGPETRGEVAKLVKDTLGADPVCLYKTSDESRRRLFCLMPWALDQVVDRRRANERERRWMALVTATWLLLDAEESRERDRADEEERECIGP